MTISLSDAYAVYGCGAFGDDTDGNYVFENLDSAKDLIKGDGSTSSTFPTFTQYSDHDTSYYAFDGIDDHVSGWTIPDGYFISAVFSTSYPDSTPYVTQVTDTTVKNLLTVSGAFTGNLHNLVVFETEPSVADKEWLADYQMRRLWSDSYIDPFSARLIRNGDCVYHLDFEHPEDLYNDYAGVSTISPTGGDSWDGGIVFSGTGQELVAADTAALRILDDVTIFLSFDPSTVDGINVSKSAEYGSALDAGASDTIRMRMIIPGGATMGTSDYVDSPSTFAGVATVGSGVAFYADGKFVNLNGSVSTRTSSSADLEFSKTAGTFYRIQIFNRALTAAEIELLHYSAMLSRSRYSDVLHRPWIVDVDGDDEISGTQTNVVLSGFRLGASTGKVYLTDSDVFSASSTVVEQSIDSWADTSIQFDVVPGAL